MNTYEVSFQFEQGELEWCDSMLYDAVDVKDLIKEVRLDMMAFKADSNGRKDWSMKVIFAQQHEDMGILAEGEEDITDEFPESMLAE
jgi:hypothetical protein